MNLASQVWRTVCGLALAFLLGGPLVATAASGTPPRPTKYCPAPTGQLRGQSNGVCGDQTAADMAAAAGNKAGEFAATSEITVSFYLSSSLAGARIGHGYRHGADLLGPEGQNRFLPLGETRTYRLTVGLWRMAPRLVSSPPPFTCSDVGLAPISLRWPDGLCGNGIAQKYADPEHVGVFKGPSSAGEGLALYIHNGAGYHGYTTDKPLALHQTDQSIPYTKIDLIMGQWNWFELGAGTWGIGEVDTRDYCGEHGVKQIPGWPAGICGNDETVLRADPHKPGELQGPSTKGAGLLLFFVTDACGKHGYCDKQLALYPITPGRNDPPILIDPGNTGGNWFELPTGRWGLGQR